MQLRHLFAGVFRFWGARRFFSLPITDRRSNATYKLPTLRDKN